MGFENYISEDQAASIAGVSTVTLKRFAEAGYLSVETDTDGLRLFSKRELSEVFGIPVEDDQRQNELRRETLREKVEVIRDRESSNSDNDVSFIDSWDDDIPAILETEELEQDPGAGEANTTSHYCTTSTGVDGVVETVPQTENVTSASPLSERTQASISEQRNVSDIEVPRESYQVNQATAAEIAALQIEVTRLSNINTLQEKVLDLREAEIADLKKQREWLEERVLRLEEKSDRDQLLLLSETQLVRQLIEVQRRRTPLRAALEWVGLVQPESPKKRPSGQAIEIGKGQTE